MLRNFIRRKRKEEAKEEVKVPELINAFEANVDKYRNKSLAWVLCITADEVGMKKSELGEILDKYYTEEEK